MSLENQLEKQNEETLKLADEIEFPINQRSINHPHEEIISKVLNFIDALEKNDEKRDGFATEFFNLVDDDGSGKMTMLELVSTFSSKGVKYDEKLEQEFMEMDPDGSMMVELDEFLDYFPKALAKIKKALHKSLTDWHEQHKEGEADNV